MKFWSDLDGSLGWMISSFYLGEVNSMKEIERVETAFLKVLNSKWK